MEIRIRLLMSKPFAVPTLFIFVIVNLTMIERYVPQNPLILRHILKDWRLQTSRLLKGKPRADKRQEEPAVSQSVSKPAGLAQLWIAGRGASARRAAVAIISAGNLEKYGASRKRERSAGGRGGRNRSGTQGNLQVGWVGWAELAPGGLWVVHIIIQAQAGADKPS